MSHELRTPLNAILGYSQILRRQPNLSESQRHQLEILYSSGEHLLTLINDLLDLGKIEAQRMDVEDAPFDLRAILRQVFNITKVKAEEKGLSLEYEPRTLLPENVRGDERKLKQILLNLLSNAVKYTQCGGVTVRGSYDQADSGVFRFEVKDSGIGIPPDKLEAIFDPFTQIRTDGQFIEGTGLGLTITRRLATLMRGNLTVTSELGKGSTFVAEVPLPIVTEGEAIVKKDGSDVVGYSGDRMRILVVDDNAANISMLVALLEPLGFEVLTAESGSDAVRRVTESRPNLMLLDMVMPRMDGLEVIEVLRMRREAMEKPRIIGVSATVTDNERKRAFIAACDDFLTKPIDVEMLLEKIGSQLEITWETARPVVPAEAPPSPTEEAVEHERASMVPPLEVLEAMQRTVERGDFGALEDMVTDWMHRDVAYATFGLQIKQFAARYDDEGIGVYLDKLKNEQHETKEG